MIDTDRDRLGVAAVAALERLNAEERAPLLASTADVENQRASAVLERSRLCSRPPSEVRAALDARARTRPTSRRSSVRTGGVPPTIEAIRAKAAPSTPPSSVLAALRASGTPTTSAPRVVPTSGRVARLLRAFGGQV